MTALLETRALSLSFGGIVAADNIDFSLQEGERLAVIGQNGAGKTTFINICTGLIKPDGGSVMFDGKIITGRSPRDIVRRGMARSFQIPQLLRSTRSGSALSFPAWRASRNCHCSPVWARAVMALQLTIFWSLLVCASASMNYATTCRKGNGSSLMLRCR